MCQRVPLDFVNSSFISRGFGVTYRDTRRMLFLLQVGYIVMNDPSTGERSNLLRMKGAKVVGVYHPLIDEKLMSTLHRYASHLVLDFVLSNQVVDTFC